MIFVTIEGTNEEVAHGNIRKERDKTLTTIRELCNDQVLATNSDLWNGRARNELMKYEEHLYDYFQAWVVGSRAESVDLLERCVLLWYHLHHHRIRPHFTQYQHRKSNHNSLRYLRDPDVSDNTG
uniref:Uncharacterized protein n=1 Tax=Apis cerana TaxID=7461 RepID=V9ILF5_APICE